MRGGEGLGMAAENANFVVRAMAHEAQQAEAFAQAASEDFIAKNQRSTSRRHDG